MANNDDKRSGGSNPPKTPAGKGGSTRPAPPKPRSADDLLARLLPIFQAEADERLRALEQNLLVLEKDPTTADRQHLIESVMRDAHSIKGGARTVNLKHVEGICQSFESVTAKVRDGALALSPGVFNVLHGTVDMIDGMLSAPQAVDQQRLDRVLGLLGALDRGEAVPEPTVAPPPAPSAPPPTATPVRRAPTAPVAATPSAAPLAAAAQRQQSVRVSLDKLDDLFRQAQEMLAVKLTTTQRCSDIREVGGQLDQWRRQWSKVDTSVRRLQAWVEANHYSTNSPLSVSARRVIEFLDWSVSHIKSLEGRVRTLGRTADQDRLSLSLMVDLLLDDTRKALMMPCSTLFAVLPRMVRDLSQAGHKQVVLEEFGDEIEIDKRIVDELKDALVHLVRNCIDHGVETPEERQRAGKPATATLRVGVNRLSNETVELCVSDDGRGIDTDKLRSAAVRNGMLSEGEARRLDYDEAVKLIFRSGLSTSPTITRISGRGLGMPIVRERVEKLGGRMSVESKPGVGTLFRMEMPVALATLRGILLKVAGQSLVMPTINVERVLRVRPGEIQTNDDVSLVTIGEEPVAVVPLSQVLRLKAASQRREHGYTLLVVVAAAGRRVAFEIDEVEDEQEVLFKSLGGFLARVPNIAGATVLGTGKVVPILNASDLVQSAFESAQGIERIITAVVEEVEVIRRILIAEDSITSRMLLKEILEAAGYHVTTAVDGADAFSLLEDREVDLVVSDVEMPRLDGFGLTQKIRSHPKHRALPVILVTGLERASDRERGTSAGASAYIVKSSFDQSDLLKAIEDLI